MIPSIQRYNWRVTWIPSDDHEAGQVKDFIGTESEVEKFAAKNEPNYEIREIEFARRGEAGA